MSDLAMLTGTVPPNGGMVQQPDHRMVKFATVPTLNAVRSRAEGRPIYDPVTVLFVRHPGERDETAVAAQPHHEYEHPRAWAAFQAGQAVDPDGTPLAILFPADPHIVMHLRGLHLFTVEQLAGIGEEAQRRIGMGARDYVAKAQKFIEASDRAAPLHQVQAELRSRDDEIATLKEQVAMLAAARTTGRRKAVQDDEGTEA